MKSITNIHNLSIDRIIKLINETSKIKNFYRINNRQSYSKQFDKTIVNLFTEPSTRTSCSFEAAAYKLGCKVISITNPSYSSIAKGESLEDTIKTLSYYGDCIVLRHNQKGASTLATTVTNLPIINAGDGDGEHPTQALLDYFTLHDNYFFDVPHTPSIMFYGDVIHSRTVHSLIELFKKMGTEVDITCVHDYETDEEFLSETEDHKCFKSLRYKYFPYSEWNGTKYNMDALYVIRPQKERWAHNKAQPQPVDISFLNKNFENNPIIMHPFPRNDELSIEVDDLDNAKYFEQIQNGVYIRMAILIDILE